MSRPVLYCISVSAAVVLLAGCAVGPNYQRPKVNVPPAFRGAEATAQQASFADLPWWDVFKDDTLKELVKTALANNYDLAIAVTRVEQARQVAAQAHSHYYPQIDYSTVTAESKGLGSLVPNSGGASSLILAVATATWEADLWGRIRRLNEAARAQYLASEEARRGVMLTLVSDVSNAYFQLLGLQRKLEVSMQSADSFGRSRKLFTDRLGGGVSSRLPVSRATANEAVALAQVTEYQREIALTEDQIRVLLGQNPGPIDVKAKLLDTGIPPEVPAGLPSALLERRPDVLTAEQNIRAANAQVGVAQAEFFPQIGLTSFFGKLSKPLEDFTSGDATIASIGLSLAGPIFTGGRLKAQKRQAVAYWEETKAQYLQTIVNAFRDVSDALISREKYEGERTDQARAVASYEDSVRLANMRYDQGFSSYYEVLEAQQQLFPAQLALAQTELDRRLVIVQLYKALGGGWNLTDAQFKNAGAP